MTKLRFLGHIFLLSPLDPHSKIVGSLFFLGTVDYKSQNGPWKVPQSPNFAHKSQMFTLISCCQS